MIMVLVELVDIQYYTINLVGLELGLSTYLEVDIRKMQDIVKHQTVNVKRGGHHNRTWYSNHKYHIDDDIFWYSHAL